MTHATLALASLGALYLLARGVVAVVTRPAPRLRRRRPWWRAGV
jgi:hypothetical protein